MSIHMVLLWAGGDLFKTGYFIVKAAPKQFWLCGITQVTIDFLILVQVAIYKSYKKVSKDEKENNWKSEPTIYCSNRK